jgi:hypothetical protein
MTDKEAMAMAKQAGISYNPGSQHDHDHFRAYGDSLEAFAKLVAEKEREACAKVCEGIFMWSYDDPGETAATAIRARGEQA